MVGRRCDVVMSEGRRCSRVVGSETRGEDNEHGDCNHDDRHP